MTAMDPEDKAAIMAYLAELKDVIEHKDKHEGHALKQVGRCVYCSCGFRYQGSLPETAP